MRDCLDDAGVSADDLHDGVVPFGDEYDAILDCKEAAMSGQGIPVDIVGYDLDGWTPWTDHDLVDLCEEVEDALDAGGSATIGFEGGGGHRVQIVDIECTDSDDDGETDEVTVTIRDPNYPNGQTHDITIDGDDDVTDVDPDHFFIDTDSDPTTVRPAPRSRCRGLACRLGWTLSRRGVHWSGRRRPRGVRGVPSRRHRRRQH